MARRPRKDSPWHVIRTPLAVWLALCLLLAATCAIAYVPLGAANLPISLVIAATKAALVGGIFMRLRTDTPLNRLAACIGPTWIAIMFLLVFADYATR
ncbi:MAG TPA: cytochrome C oxidase subunit IV family protein [Rhizomicrobium sp.]|jgi:cytochrome c oxidase subunit 4|nr:cytochrome C oxidase subunit IV family protein [Rhizomicrobium sp.]